MSNGNEENLKCQECGRPAFWYDGKLDFDNHADDCAGLARRVLTVVPA